MQAWRSVALVVLVGACSHHRANPRSIANVARGPLVPAGELRVILGPGPDSTIVIGADGAFEIAWSSGRTSLAGCDGVCPPRVERFAITGEAIRQGSVELLARLGGGSIHGAGGGIRIDDDGTLIQSGHVSAVDGDGWVQPVRGGLRVQVVGAITPALKRRAMLVVVLVELGFVGAAMPMT